MNLHILHQSVTKNMNAARPIIDSIFNDIIVSVKKNPRSVNIKSLLDTINDRLKGTKIRVVQEKTKFFGDPRNNNFEFYPAIGGYCYEPEKETLSARIKIILCTYPGINRFPLSVESWEYFRYRFLKTLTHELVHRAQFAGGRLRRTNLTFRPHTAANIDKKLIKEQEYLGDIDEIEAYARDCVEEWYYHKQIPLTLREVKKEFRQTGGVIPALQFYSETYQGDETHPSIQRLFRKVKIWNEILTPIASEIPSAPMYVLNEQGSCKHIQMN